MLGILCNRTYRHLFAAQVIALLGTGLMTVALGLLAYDLAGPDAGAVLGTALAIKMIAYVGVAPVAQAFTDQLPRRPLLVGLDLIRGAVALCLPFVTEIWHIYLLILVLQSASAAFTPTFQATIPEILPDEGDYTRALSLSRLAYDLENLVSPMLAAALLSVISFQNLFAGTVVGFLASALLVLRVRLPVARPRPRSGIWDRTTRGMRIYLATPRLRGLLAINLAVAATGSMVIVNTVLLVKRDFSLAEPQVALALAIFGAGSMIAALALPRVLDQLSDRPVMIAGACLLAGGAATGTLVSSFGLLLMLWLVLGFGYSAAQIPSGRLLRRSAHPADRPALFAAQFALSHGCWLICYPLAGYLGATVGMDGAFAAMAATGLVGVVMARRLWPSDDPAAVPHQHPDLPADHLHLRRFGSHAHHRHPFVIDDLHARWPT